MRKRIRPLEPNDPTRGKPRPLVQDQLKKAVGGAGGLGGPGPGPIGPGG